jgi:hypothetical protein
LAATKLSTAPRQSMRPPGSILKISRGGVIGVHDLSGRHLCTNFVPGGLSCFGHLVSHTRADAACRAPTFGAALAVSLGTGLKPRGAPPPPYLDALQRALRPARGGATGARRLRGFLRVRRLGARRS